MGTLTSSAELRKAMRRILLNRIPDRKRLKRCGSHEHVVLDDFEIPVPSPDEELLALDRLATENLLAAEMVGLRYFVGLKVAWASPTTWCQSKRAVEAGT